VTARPPLLIQLWPALLAALICVLCPVASATPLTAPSFRAYVAQVGLPPDAAPFAPLGVTDLDSYEQFDAENQVPAACLWPGDKLVKLYDNCSGAHVADRPAWLLGLHLAGFCKSLRDPSQMACDAVRQSIACFQGLKTKDCTGLQIERSTALPDHVLIRDSSSGWCGAAGCSSPWVLLRLSGNRATPRVAGLGGIVVALPSSAVVVSIKHAAQPRRVELRTFTLNGGREICAMTLEPEEASRGIGRSRCLSGGRL